MSPSHAEPWNGWAGWALACSCGSKNGKLLGHSLQDCNPEYDGPPSFGSPLAFLCASCDQITEIIDTKKHGYDSEMGLAGEGKSWDVNYHGSGPRQVVQCPNCSRNEFAITTNYSHSHFDHVEDEPELEPRAQDYFDCFACRGKCTECRTESVLASFELA